MYPIFYYLNGFLIILIDLHEKKYLTKITQIANYCLKKIVLCRTIFTFQLPSFGNDKTRC